MKTYGWPSDTGACKFYRSDLPAQALRGLGHDAQVCEGTRIDPWVADEADRLVIVQRSANPSARVWLNRQARDHDRPFVFDIDDYLWSLDHTNPAWEFYKRPETRDSLQWMVDNAALVTCSTETLAARLRDVTSTPVAVIPNALSEAHVQPRLAERPHTILWRGSATHDRDVELVAYALKRAEKAGVRIVIAGHDYRRALGLQHAECLDDILLDHPEWGERARKASQWCQEDDGRQSKLRRRVWLSPQDYLDAIRDVVQPTIALCPLRSTAFGDCKSHISALEAHAAGCVVLASDMPSFQWYLTPGTGILVRANEHDWWKALQGALDMTWGEWALMAEEGARRATETSVEALAPLYAETYAKVAA